MAFLNVVNWLIRRDLNRCGVVSRTVDFDGAQVHYYDAPGRGGVPPLLLVHGFGDTANSWYQVIGPLARSLGRVYAIDVPGNGVSKLAEGHDHFTLEEAVQLVGRFAREVIGEPAFLLGQSLGGATVLRLAARDVRPWLGVIALAPAGAKMSDEEWTNVRSAFEVQDRAGVRALFARTFTTPPLPARLMESDMLAVWKSTPIRKLMESLRPEDILTPEELARLQLPVAILWGTDEKLLPMTSLGYYRSHLPSAHIEVVQSWDHMPQFTWPNQVVEKVARFVETVLGAQPEAGRTAG